MREKISIVGAGAWGTALACISARAGHETLLWGRSQEVVDEINAKKTNQKYLGNLELHQDIKATTNLSDALDKSSLILLSIPTQTISSRLQDFPTIPAETIIVTTCKGIDRRTGKLPAELTAETFPSNNVGALSGPSFAVDVVANLPTAVTVASKSEGVADILASLLSHDLFRCYASTDLKGVELGGALKNVLALAVGATRGMELGASAEAALIARGFAEITRLAVNLGAKAETLSGLSGLGDLVLTCSSTKSRNFTYGIAMGRGDSLDGLKLAEGAFTASVANKIARERGLEMPVTEAIVEVLDNRITAHEAVRRLLSRPLKREQ